MERIDEGDARDHNIRRGVNQASDVILKALSANFKNKPPIFQQRLEPADWTWNGFKSSKT